MRDIYETTIICANCNKPTEKFIKNMNGFELRAWRCPCCKQEWYHPIDMESYKEYMKLKQRHFQVKLRVVGNSWAISIPKEIIEFEEVRESKPVQLSLDEPGKITIKFTRIRKIIKHSKF